MKFFPIFLGLSLDLYRNLVQKVVNKNVLSCSDLRKYYNIKNIKIMIYRNIIFPVAFYGCETWSFALWEERRLRVFENGVLRKIFVSKRDKVLG